MPEERQISNDVRSVAYDILVESMIHVQAALNASMAILDLTMSDHAFAVTDELSQAQRHLLRGVHFMYKMPVVDDPV